MNRLFFLAFMLMLNFYNDELVDIANCPEEIMCSEDFQSITVHVVDSEGRDVILDDFFTFIKTSGKIYQYDKFSPNGYYTVLTDDEISEVNESGSKIIFRGSKDGKDIIYEFEVGKNCCHILKLSGDEQIALASGI